jgi:hypothetical protein
MITTEQNRNTLRKIRPGDISLTVSPTWPDLGLNTSLRNNRSATKRLNRGTANRNKHLPELYIKTFSSYRTVNTLRLGNKNQFVNAV